MAGESLVQGALGGAAGLVIGLAGIWAINLISPTIVTAPEVPDMLGAGGPQGGAAGAPFVQASTEITLTAPLTPWVVVAAVGLAVAAGLIAGAVGGWRAARLSPAEALRSVA